MYMQPPTSSSLDGTQRGEDSEERMRGKKRKREIEKKKDRGQMDSSERDQRDWEESQRSSVISLDILWEILRRLPTRSLIRFRHVSKSWHALIFDNPKYLPQPMHGFFYNNSEHVYYYTVSNINPNHHNSNKEFSKHMQVKCICNGLLLYSFSPAQNAVYNPATGRYADIPLLNSYPTLHMFALACDPLFSRHFFVIAYHVGTGNIYVFSSKTREWIKGPIQWPDGWISWEKKHHPPVFFAGNICLLNWRRSSILQIDPKRVTCKTTDLSVSISNFDEHCLGVSRSNMHYAMRKDTTIHVFVIQDYETNTWILEHTINLEAIVRGLQFHGSSQDVILGFHPDLNKIFLSLQGKLFSCDLHTADFTVICSQKIEVFGFWSYSPCYLKGLDLDRLMVHS